MLGVTEMTEPPSPLEIYRTLMADAKLRLLASERVIGAKKPRTGLQALDMEFCFLQVRRVIEDITFGALVREEKRYTALRQLEKTANPRDHGDPARDWQAPEMLKRLVALSPHALPIPHRTANQVSPGFVHCDRENIEVNHGRLIDLYKKCGGFLHGANPLGTDFATATAVRRHSYETAPQEVNRALAFLRTLLWQHAALTLDEPGSEDPRTPASPRRAWLVVFGNDASPDVAITVAEAA